MADMRIPPSGSFTPQVRAPQRNDAARAAQRAFFDAARGAATAPDVAASRGPAVVRSTAQVAAPRPVQQATSVDATTAPATTSAAVSADAPQRLRRPGSLLNILV